MADVFPRRNLPSEAEEWGRKVEDRIYQAENLQAMSGQSLSGLNRSSSGTLGSLAEQVQQVQRLYNAIPIPKQATTSVTGFGVPSTGAWNTIASVSITPDASGTLAFAVVGSGQLVSSNSGNLMCSFRILLSTGSSSPAVPGLYAFSGGVGGNNFLVNWAWAISVTTTPVTISIQANPAAGETWGSGTGSYVALSAFGTLTR